MVRVFAHGAMGRRMHIKKPLLLIEKSSPCLRHVCLDYHISQARNRTINMTLVVLFLIGNKMCFVHH